LADQPDSSNKLTERWWYVLIVLASATAALVWYVLTLLGFLRGPNPQFITQTGPIVLSSPNDSREKGRPEGPITKPPPGPASAADRYENVSLVRQPGRRQAAILVWPEGDGPSVSNIEAEIADLLEAKDVHPVRSFFTPEFVRDGQAMDLFSGKWVVAKRLELEKHVDHVVLGVAKVSFRSNDDLAGLITGDLDIELKCLDVVTLSVSATRNITVAGAGYTEAAALATSIDHARPELEAFVRQID
jgi:hypothetical protein